MKAGFKIASQELFMRYVAVRLFGYILAAAFPSISLYADPVTVRHPQGASHGFLALKTLDGKRIATGDVTAVVHGDRVTSRLIFRFRDGSIDDDTTVFSQHGVIRLISDHHIQHGPSFPKSTDVFIDAVTGQVASHTEDGTVTHDHLDLPPDVSNGLPPNLLLNIPTSTLETTLSYVAPTTKPRLIHISIKPSGNVPFSIGDSHREATDYIIHVELGGMTGIVAPIIGKQPADFHIWIYGGPTPAFIREEGQLYLGGPIWRIEQISSSFAP